MADESRTAEVQLTADVSGYTQGMNQAYEQTNLMVKAVNQLSTSLEGITKRMGKKLLIFAAADVAMLTGMTALTARYEKQLATLRVQADLNNKSFQTYKSGISDLSKQLPKSRGELVQLVTQIEHLGITSERESLKMAKVFTNLAGATGEDVSGLTQGMIELGRAMGTLGGGAGQMENFTDSLVKVAADSGVAAQSVVNFANSISPFARSAGIGEAALLGISAAFTRAGADGYAAANTFNTIIADITRQIQNGSPEIAKYASAIGVTAEQFKKMDMTERITQIFEAVNKAGPGGIRIMDQLGQDGIRAARSIQQVSNEAGGLRRAIETSVDAYGGGATEKGASIAFDTLDSKLSILRNNMDILGSAIGEAVLPPAKALLNVFNNMVTSVSGFLAPLLTAAGLMGAVLAPFTAAAGTLLTLMGPLSTLMMVFMAARLSPLKAFGQGAKEGVLVKQGIQGPGPVTDMGRRMAVWKAEQAAAAKAGIAPDTRLRPAWYQRAGFGLGQMAGATQAGVGLSKFTIPSLTAVGTGAARLVGSFASGTSQWARDAAVRGNAIFDKQSMARALETPIARAGGFFRAASTAITDPGAQGGMWKTFKAEMDASSAAIKANAAANSLNSGSKGVNTSATNTNTGSLSQRIRAEVTAAGTMEAFSLAVRKATGQVLLSGVNMAGFGVRAGSQIAGGLGRAGSAIFGGLGGLIGGGTPTGVVMAGVGTAAYFAKQASDKMNEGALTQDSLTNLGPTNIALGEATQQLKNFSLTTLTSTRAITSFFEALQTTSVERLGLGDREVKDDRMKSLSTDVQLLAFLRSMGKMSPEQLHSLYLDMASQFGFSRADTISKKYLDATKGGTDPYAGGFGEISTPLLTQAAKQTNQGIVGGARSNWGLGHWGMLLNPFASFGARQSVDTSTQQMTNQVWASIDQNAKDQEMQFNPKAGYIQKSIDAQTAMGTAIAGRDTPGGKAVLQESLKNYERLVLGGVELNANTGSLGLPGDATFRLNGQEITNNEDFYRSQFDEGNESTKAWRQSQREAGLTLGDYLDGGKGLGKKLIAAQYAIPTEVEKKVGSTQLGALTLQSDTIEAVTSGESVATPTMTRKAIDEMTASALKNADATGGVTTAFQTLSNNAGAASSYLFQLAQAAMKEAQATEVYNQKSKGWVAVEAKRYDQVVKQLAQPLENADETKALVEEKRATREDVRTRLQQIILAQRAFDLQQKRAIRDFEKQKERALEDSSAGWQNAYTRGANQQQLTNSPGLVVFNAEEQLDTAKGQLAGLRKLTGMGLSKDARNMMNLTDPSMGNQTIRFAATADKAWVAVMNQLAKERKAVVGDLTKEFSTPFQRAEEDFRIATADAILNMHLMGDEAVGTIEELFKEASKYSSHALDQVALLYENMQLSEQDAAAQKQARRDEFLAGRLNGEPTEPIVHTEFGLAGGTATVPTKPKVATDWLEEIMNFFNGTPAPRPVKPTSSVPTTDTWSSEIANALGNLVGYFKPAASITTDDAGSTRTNAYNTPVSTIKGDPSSQSYHNSTNYNINSLKVESPNVDAMQKGLEEKARRTNLRRHPGGEMR